MSGLEVAGLVLGALPILFHAIDAAKGSYQRVRVVFRKQIYVSRLARALLLQKQTLTETVSNLAVASGCKNIIILETDPLGYLEDETVQAELLDYMGTDNTRAFIEAIEGCHEIIRKISKNISGLVPDAKGASTEDIAEIIRVNADIKKKRLDVLPRVKLLFKVKDLKIAAEELDNSTSAIERFARVVLANRQGSSEISSRKAARIAKGLRSIHETANDLHLSIRKGWKDACHGEHEIRLMLEDRLDVAASRSERCQKSQAITPLTFPMMLLARVHHGQVIAHETEIEVLKVSWEDGKKSSETARSPRHSRIRIQDPLPSYEETGLPSNFTIMDGICNAIDAVTTKRIHVSFPLAETRQMGVIALDKTTAISNHTCDRISLRELLVPGKDGAIFLPLKLRMLLALQLASNLLQLLQTQWLQNPWSKDLVYFQKSKPGTSTGSGKAKLARPFVALEFCSIHHSERIDSPLDMSTASVSSVEPKVALLELGILLLEIWHEETLETHFELDNPPSGYYERLPLAFQWLDDMSDPLPDLYDHAASRCIRGVIGGQSHYAGWNDMAFWVAICGDIIEPLSKNVRQWRSRPS